MLMLRPMRTDQYLDFLDYFITDYAIEIAANYDLEHSTAKDRAISEVERDLPQGIDTPGHTLTCIVDLGENTERVVGYLWYKVNVKMRELYICDFYIFPAEQGKGHGKEALRLLENEAGIIGLHQIKLRVAANNRRAKNLYDAFGFHVTGINMSKHIAERGDN
ncbi:GNAT family N-acetyltransferase [Phyllobacterium sp. K27]